MITLKTHPQVKHLSGKIIILLLIAMTFIAVFITLYSSKPLHCVTGVFSSDTPLVIHTQEYRCFATQAEAIYYATGGGIQIPANASSLEVDAALRANHP